MGQQHAQLIRFATEFCHGIIILFNGFHRVEPNLIFRRSFLDVAGLHHRQFIAEFSFGIIAVTGAFNRIGNMAVAGQIFINAHIAGEFHREVIMFNHRLMSELQKFANHLPCGIRGNFVFAFITVAGA